MRSCRSPIAMPSSPSSESDLPSLRTLLSLPTEIKAYIVRLAKEQDYAFCARRLPLSQLGPEEEELAVRISTLFGEQGAQRAVQGPSL